MNRKFILAGALAVLTIAAGVSVYFLSGGVSSGSDPTAVFPDRTSRRVVVSHQSTGEELRVIDLKADGLTPEKAEVWFRDGAIGHIHYRDDGTISTFDAFYPEPETGSGAGSRRQLKLDAEFDLDGRTYLREAHYREDGTPSRIGVRLASGDYEIRDFYADGIKLAALDLRDRSGKRSSLTRWYETGVVQQTVLRDKEGAVATTDFDDAGLKTAYHWVFYNKETWEAYRPGAETLLNRFEMKAESAAESVSYYVHAHYYKPDGSLDHERKFGPGHMEVIFRDAAGGIAYVQRWMHSGQATSPELMTQENYHLGLVVLGGDNLLDNDTVWFYDDGKTVEKLMSRVDFADGLVGIVVHEFHPDGSLKTRRLPRVEDGKVVYDSVSFKPGESKDSSGLGSAKAEWLETIPYALPPKAPIQEVYISGP